MSSAKSRPPLCHHIAQETVLLTYSLECHHRRAVFTPYLSRENEAMENYIDESLKRFHPFFFPGCV
jgi:hypothetical protein